MALDEDAAIAAFEHDADEDQPALQEFLPPGVPLEVAYGVILMLYCLYFTQPPQHAQRVLIPHDLCNVLAAVAEAASVGGASDVVRCLCVLVRYVQYDQPADVWVSLPLHDRHTYALSFM